MKRLLALMLFAAACSSQVYAQRCDSITASYSGGWKPVLSAPRDGRTVEMMQTYGIAAWYGLFKWTKENFYRDQNGGMHKFTAEASWVSVDRPGHGVTSGPCLFWRPYKNSGNYVDPTGGAQFSVAYWCAAAHKEYDPKADKCK